MYHLSVLTWLPDVRGHIWESWLQMETDTLSVTAGRGMGGGVSHWAENPRG